MQLVNRPLFERKRTDYLQYYEENDRKAACDEGENDEVL